MLINRNTWHFKVYSFTYNFNDVMSGRRTTLCRYVWRLILYPVPKLLSWIAFVIFVGALFCFVHAVGNVWTILTGQGWFHIRDSHGSAVIPFKNVSIAGHIIAPTSIAAAIWTIMGLGTLLWFIGPKIVHKVSAHADDSLLYAGIVTAGVVVLYVVYRVFIALVYGIRHSEGWNLFMSYLKARKEGVCPLITFE